ncbi:MAG: hypothetical protein IPL08_13300 [Saprospiraceae bacterium]|nr:hypothetical protein [Saprospiraceae bacterium]MBK8670173.1 hypothetical protein [Saprospiraceae bacterium]
MKNKILTFLLILTSLIGYLEWSGDNHTFLFQAEVEIVHKLFTNPSSVVHPFILLPLIGQILLFITLFQKPPSKILTYISIGGLGMLLGFMFIIGLISLNFKILLSSIPFIIVAVLKIKHLQKTKPNIDNTANY